MPRHWLTTLTLLALSPAAANAWDLNDCKFSADRSVWVDTTGAERIELIARAGDLRIDAGPAGNVKGSGRACASNEDYLAQTKLVGKRDGNVVRIAVTTPDDMKGLGMLYAYLDLKLVVPADIPVKVLDSSGDMELHGVNIMRIDDSSGDIVATDLRGNIEIQDSSGDIRVERVAGNVTVNDSSGGIDVRNARNVLIPSDSSGDISISHSSGDVKIDSDSSGDVHIDDVGRNFALLSDGSGEVSVHNVKGTITLPPDH